MTGRARSAAAFWKAVRNSELAATPPVTSRVAALYSPRQPTSCLPGRSPPHAGTKLPGRASANRRLRALPRASGLSMALSGYRRCADQARMSWVST